MTLINVCSGANNKSLQKYRILFWKLTKRRVSQILIRLFQVKQWMISNNKLSQNSKDSGFLKLWGHSGCIWKQRGKVELKFVNKYTFLKKPCLNVMISKALLVNWIKVCTSHLSIQIRSAFPSPNSSLVDQLRKTTTTCSRLVWINHKKIFLRQDRSLRKTIMLFHCHWMR